MKAAYIFLIYIYSSRNNFKTSSKKALAHKAKSNAKRQAIFDDKYGLSSPLEWFCYSNPYDFY
jgi:hypothetical protein